MLKWSTGSATLSAENLNLEGAKDLSEPNQRLLLQHGAIESPQTPAQVHQAIRTTAHLKPRHQVVHAK